MKTIKTRRWDRKLWGVEFRSASSRPLLISEAWNIRAGAHSPERHFGEPIRALLFTTRAAARVWCDAENASYLSHHDDGIVRTWRVRPVRVRERVEVVR